MKTTYETGVVSPAVLSNERIGFMILNGEKVKWTNYVQIVQRDHAEALVDVVAH